MREERVARRTLTHVLAARVVETAVGAFTAYGIDGAAGIVRAGERSGSPLILLVSAETFASPFGKALVCALRTFADDASVPCVVELDHVRTIKAVRAGFLAGVDAVMADGSRLPLAENKAFVREAVRIARDYGGAIEAELGRVEGDEDVSSGVAVGRLTDPMEAEDFVLATEVDCLAVSVGNVHGFYRVDPKIDTDLISAIAARTGVPLSLHGASGIPESMLRRAIACGIGKVNFNTELRAAYFRTLALHGKELEDGARLQQLATRVSESIAATVDERLAVLENR